MTFDTEDFISENSVPGLFILLNQLESHKIKALFFISGHMAERLSGNQKVLDLLNNHEIGYHSSAHSVHPTIFEFTDVESYEKAYTTALIRETSHINPLTGEVESEGGVLALKKVFPSKAIASFRAPGFCWSPPDTEALRDLGIKYDFSTNLSTEPTYYKGITFYPYQNVGDWTGSVKDYRLFLQSIFQRKLTTAGMHPSLFVNQTEWDSIFWKGNPQKMLTVPQRQLSEIRLLHRNFNLFLDSLNLLEKAKLVNTKPHLAKSSKKLHLSRKEVAKSYELSVRWPRRFYDYEPKYLRGHFERFFADALQ